MTFTRIRCGAPGPFVEPARVARVAVCHLYLCGFFPSSLKDSSRHGDESRASCWRPRAKLFWGKNLGVRGGREGTSWPRTFRRSADGVALTPAPRVDKRFSRRSGHPKGAAGGEAKGYAAYPVHLRSSHDGGRWRSRRFFMRLRSLLSLRNSACLPPARASPGKRAALAGCDMCRSW